MTQQQIMEYIRDEIARETKIEAIEISFTDTFAALGLDSISGVYLLDRLEKKLNTELNPLMLWDYPTILELSKYLARQKDIP